MGKKEFVESGSGGACFENIRQFSVISFPGYLTLQKVQSSQWYCNKEEGGGGDIDNPGLGAWLGPYQQARLHHRMHQHHHTMRQKSLPEKIHESIDKKLLAHQATKNWQAYSCSITDVIKLAKGRVNHLCIALLSPQCSTYSTLCSAVGCHHIYIYIAILSPRYLQCLLCCHFYNPVISYFSDGLLSHRDNSFENTLSL